ncbi:hypothetical protein ACFL1P_01335 [Patescibacteria group bacterium]
MDEQKKLKVGWFSFSCCEDSTILFTEILNDHYKEWKKLIEFRSAIVLQKKETLSDIDVSFIEGAVTSQEQEDKVKKIRSVSKKVVAIGSCAVAGNPSNWRDTFDEKTREEIEPILVRFQYAPSVKKLADVIQIDDQVAGCPMQEQAFLTVVNKYLEEFGIVKKPNNV